MNHKLAIYPGTFDPLTNGHLSIIKRALKIFDKLIIAILINPNKTPLFSLDERISMLKEIFKNEENVEIDTFNGLLIDYAVKKKSNIIVRGLRALSDFEYKATAEFYDPDRRFRWWNGKLSRAARCAASSYVV